MMKVFRVFKENRELRAQVAQLSGRLERVEVRTPVLVGQEKVRRDRERLTILAGVRESDPVWQTVLSYLDEHERNEKEVALAPGLVDGVRQFNSGRQACAYDLACALRNLKAKADELVGRALEK